jgi:hypothetical protein
MEPSVAGNTTEGEGVAKVLAKFADERAAIVDRRVGEGRVMMLGLWAGLAYSSTVRRSDYDMNRDFSESLRRLITGLALERQVKRPAIPSQPLVEAIALRNSHGKSVALMNWCYAKSPAAGGGRSEQLRQHDELQVLLAGFAGVQRVRSLALETDLQFESRKEGIVVTIPRLATIDLLMLSP